MATACDEVVITEKTVEEKMVTDMKIAAHQRLSVLLRPNSLGKDWRNLAELMGFKYEEIVNLECDLDPVESIVRQWERKSWATIRTLISYLEKLKRYDAIEDLQPFIDETPLPSEKKKLAAERRQQRPATVHVCLPPELESLTVSDEYYDAFICYATEDRSFANEILKKLEAQPYCRKVCIDYRDYVPGNSRLEQTAAIIEERCQRIIVLLSRHFENSEDAGFQVKIALNLSPDARRRRVIPIKYDECDVPRMLRHITYLDYVNDNVQDYFWNRLASSLGYMEAR